MVLTLTEPVEGYVWDLGRKYFHDVFLHDSLLKLCLDAQGENTDGLVLLQVAWQMYDGQAWQIQKASKLWDHQFPCPKLVFHKRKHSCF